MNGMDPAPLVLLLLAAAPADDAAHLQDRTATAALNRQAAATVAQRDHGNDRALEQYDAARARYEKQMREWHRRVEACQAGDWSACR